MDRVFLLETQLRNLHRPSSYGPVAHIYENCTSVNWKQGGERGWISPSEKVWLPAYLLEAGIELHRKRVTLCGTCEKRRRHEKEAGGGHPRLGSRTATHA